ncbi:hypothetical protein OIDMADRAFT_57763 [Oidiodendron maius Zn]|uniref:Uncharacterized protein n=1 Tax=Oidiodendron maius (strain Zn) TaxID=913774 RepID=A0A0C3GM09_OIDMZ|nr:hypothetical protein OIDMADRAFT_57763 [Oidiodendron maius Zn]
MDFLPKVRLHPLAHDDWALGGLTTLLRTEFRVALVSNLSYLTNVVPHPDGTLIAVGGLYAPTIRYHKRKFYIICTNVFDGHFENFFITCTDIRSNNWSDPIYFDFHGIDPSLFFDDDGRA